MGNRSFFSHLRRVMRKFKLLLNFGTNRWRLASMIGEASWRLSFTDRPGNVYESEDLNRLTGMASYRPEEEEEEDIDKRAEMFIANFHRQLGMERQVSLQLKYLRGNSFGYISP